MNPDKLLTIKLRIVVGIFAAVGVWAVLSLLVCRWCIVWLPTYPFFKIICCKVV